MNGETFSGGLEPERFELFEGPRYRFELQRREFLEALGGGVLVVLAAPAVGAGTAIEAGDFGGEPPADPIASWLHVGKDGAVTAFTGKVEVGQAIRTSLSQVIAEELGVPIARIRLVMGDTDSVPYDRGTFGSRTTPTMARQLRRVAAATRELLVELAAERWSVEPAALELREGAIEHPPSGRRAGFGELTGGKELTREVRDDPDTVPPAQWRVAGRSVPRVGGRELVTGRHRFPSDIRRPEMLHGVVVRPEVLGSRLESVDTMVAQAMPGVTVVVDGDFVGVAAPTEHEARLAAEAIEARWAPPERPADQATLFDDLREPARGGRGRGRRGRAARRGDVGEAMAAAAHRLEATYTVAYIQHAPLEPRAAVAEWQGDRLVVWTGSQRPFGVRAELAAAFRIPEERVRVRIPDTGSGYGGKHTGEAAIEAARLARATGKPVALRWTREEEFTWAYFRPAGVIDVRAGADEAGRLLAWEFHNYNSGASALEPRYAVANVLAEYHPAEAPLRQGSYRALAATANHFARESAIDELALACGLDPLAFRRQNLDDDRLRAVLDAAAERFGWERALAEGHGRGIACGYDKGGYVATCAEVAVPAEGAPRVLRLVTAFECGAILNPDDLQNQIEGAVVMGLGGALFEAVRFAGGRIENARFSRYRVPRFGDCPELETVLVDRKDLPSAGAGETPIVGVAPAIANAIAQAGGGRRRSLPLL